MTSGVGHFDSQGNPCLKFHMCGVFHPLPGLEFEGIIDTGFTGFLQIPIQHAFSLKLPLEGTSSYVLADGSKGTSLTALANISYAGKERVGVVSLAFGSKDILVGMDFLRTFKLGVIIMTGTIILLDEEQAGKVAEEASQDAADESSDDKET